MVAMRGLRGQGSGVRCDQSMEREGKGTEEKTREGGRDDKGNGERGISNGNQRTWDEDDAAGCPPLRLVSGSAVC